MWKKLWGSFFQRGGRSNWVSSLRLQRMRYVRTLGSSAHAPRRPRPSAAGGRISRCRLPEFRAYATNYYCTTGSLGAYGSNEGFALNKSS